MASARLVDSLRQLADEIEERGFTPLFSDNPRDVIMFYDAQSGEEIIADLVDKFGIATVMWTAQECHIRGGPIKRMWMDEEQVTEKIDKLKRMVEGHQG